MIVMKFGGTSVESAEAIGRVAEIVRARMERRPVVVVSAMGKTTNMLLEIGEMAAKGKRDCLAYLGELRDFHLRESAGLGIEKEVNSQFKELKALVGGLMVMNEMTPRATDAISSYGERISSSIVNAFFHKAGIPSLHWDSRCVIVTDSRHMHAAVSANVRQA